MSHSEIHLLLIEDNPGDARLVEAYLDEIEDTSLVITNVTTLAAAITTLENNKPDVILLDMGLPDSNGIDTFFAIRNCAADTPIVVMTGVARDDLAIASVKAGAQDYLIKGEFDPHTLTRSVRYAIERSALQRAEEALQSSRYALRIAREIQFLLFPVGRPRIDGFDIGGATFPASGVDGDYYDYLELNDGSTAITIGDACGHGLGAALLSARTHACLRTLILSVQNPGEMLKLANRVLASGMSPNRFVTMLIACLDAKTKQLTYASAGHPSGYVLSPDGDIKNVLNSTGYPLGVEQETTYDVGTPVQLVTGDIVILTTDGITEARMKQTDCFGVERMLDVVRDHRQETAMNIVEAMHDAVMAFCPEPTAVDDITAVVIKCE